MRRSWTALGAAAALSALCVTVPPASAKDDAAKLKAGREAVRKKYVEKKGAFPFVDLFWYVDAKKLNDSRWRMEDVDNDDHRTGMQLSAKFEMVTAAGLPKIITVYVRKYAHKLNNRDRVLEFKHWAKTVNTRDVRGMHEGFFEDFKRRAKDVVEGSLVPSEKVKKAGPADLFASVTGTDPDRNAKQRRDWYAWQHGNPPATYIAHVRFSEGLLKSEKVLAKGREFIARILPLKEKKVKWD